MKKKLDRLEMSLMWVMWNNILQNTDRVNVKNLVLSFVRLCACMMDYGHIPQIWETGLMIIEVKVRSFISDGCECSEATTRKRIRKRMAEDGPSADAALSPKRKLRVSNFLGDHWPVVAIVEAEKRRLAYTKMYDRFGFLTDKQLSTVEVREKAHKLVEAYPSDLEDTFVDKFTMFRSLNIDRGVDSVT